jgi:hypothetical protein
MSQKLLCHSWATSSCSWASPRLRAVREALRTRAFSSPTSASTLAVAGPHRVDASLEQTQKWPGVAVGFATVLMCTPGPTGYGPESTILT